MRADASLPASGLADRRSHPAVVSAGQIGQIGKMHEADGAPNLGISSRKNRHSYTYHRQPPSLLSDGSAFELRTGYVFGSSSIAARSRYPVCSNRSVTASTVCWFAAMSSRACVWQRAMRFVIRPTIEGLCNNISVARSENRATPIAPKPKHSSRSIAAVVAREKSLCPQRLLLQLPATSRIGVILPGSKAHEPTSLVSKIRLRSVAMMTGPIEQPFTLCAARQCDNDDVWIF